MLSVALSLLHFTMVTSNTFVSSILAGAKLEPNGKTEVLT